VDVKKVFEFYNNRVKPLYCEIEARNNTLPAELLFEIHAAFDHLKRYHIGEETETIACDRAHSHLKRGLLDAFKLKLKYFNEDARQMMSCKADLTLIDNGAFYPAFVADRHKIIEMAKEARLKEANRDREHAFVCWVNTALAIDEFTEKHFARHDHLSWAQLKTSRLLGKDSIRGIIIGIISSSIVWFFTSRYFCN